MSRTSGGSILYHILSYWGTRPHFEEIQFLLQTRFWGNFWNFDLWVKFRFFFTKCLKIWFDASKTFSESPIHSQIQWMSLYDDLNEIQKIIKITNFCDSPLWSSNDHFQSNARNARKVLVKCKIFCIFGKYMLVPTKNIFTIFSYLL